MQVYIRSFLAKHFTRENVKRRVNIDKTDKLEEL